MKLILHFGIHRTGSTSIQKCLENSYNVLKSHGFLYPKIKGMNGHIQLPWGLNKSEITPKEIVDAILEQKNALTHTCILSAEDFSLVESKEFFDVLNQQFEVESIVYLKRQDLWLESWYNQNIKWPWNRKFSSSTPGQFLANYEKNFWWISYDKLIKHIHQQTSSDKLTVRVVDPKQVTNTVQDFLAYANINPEWLNDYEQENSSLTSAQIDLLRRIDLIDLSAEKRMKLLSSLKALPIEEDNGKKYIFSQSQLEEIILFYRKSNEKVAKKIFSRSELFSSCKRREEKPAFISDEKAYFIYIPELLKRVL